MLLYERFKDEAEFREKFVKPLLNRLGYYGVSEQHGTQEFGNLISLFRKLAGFFFHSRLLNLFARRWGRCGWIRRRFLSRPRFQFQAVDSLKLADVVGDEKVGHGGSCPWSGRENAGSVM